MLQWSAQNKYILSIFEICYQSYIFNRLIFLSTLSDDNQSFSMFGRLWTTYIHKQNTWWEALASQQLACSPHHSTVWPVLLRVWHSTVQSCYSRVDSGWQSWVWLDQYSPGLVSVTAVTPISARMERLPIMSRAFWRQISFLKRP